MASLRIVADQNIPGVTRVFDRFGRVVTKPGSEISSIDVRNADILLVRSVTAVDQALLDGSSVRFVGSATSGVDHVDRAHLDEHGIEFAYAPGSNASSVADYVVTALLEVARGKDRTLAGGTAGVVGCGHVGQRVARRLEAVGMTVLRNDPPRAKAAEARGDCHDFVSKETLLKKADILTLHVPLIMEGPHPTRHLVDERFIRCLGSDGWLLNTARGPVVKTEALRTAAKEAYLGAVVLDVWEHEPVPDEELLQTVDLATPHIAGYAFDAKVRGTRMLYQALCRHLDVEPLSRPVGDALDEPPYAFQCIPPDPRLPKTNWLHRLVRQAYDIEADDARTRELLNVARSERGHEFRRLRQTYRRRRELQKFVLPSRTIPREYRRAVTAGLTMKESRRG